MQREPGEHAFPTVRVTSTSFVRVSETFVTNDDPSAAFDRGQTPGDRGDAVRRVPVVLPGLYECVGWADLAELAAYREGLAVLAHSVAPPHSPDAHVSCPFRDPVKIWRAPPERDFFRSDRAKYTLHWHRDVNRCQDHSFSHVCDRAGGTAFQIGHHSLSRCRFKLLRLSIQNAR